jgi:DNA-binding XRE family transcriptional regulator
VTEAVIEGERSDEVALHQRFRHQHSRGEWFHWAREIADFVAAQKHLERPRRAPKSALEEWRRSNRMTLEDVAARCNTSHASIQRVECGRQNPSLGLAVALEDLTGIPARTFLLRRAA